MQCARSALDCAGLPALYGGGSLLPVAGKTHPAAGDPTAAEQAPPNHKSGSKLPQSKARLAPGPTRTWRWSSTSKTAILTSP